MLVPACFVCASEATAQTPGERRLAAWDSIITTVQNELPKLHVSAFHTLPRAQFDAGANAIRDSIPLLGDHVLFTRVIRLVASIGDGHTSVNTLGMPLKRLPLHFAKLDNKLYVTHAPAEMEWRGAEVLRIGNLEASAALSAVAALIARDNDYLLDGMAPYYLAVPEILSGLGMCELDGAVPLVVRRAKGDTVSLALEPVDRSKWIEIYLGEPAVPRYLSRLKDNYWLDVLPEHSIIYMRYQRARDIPELPFSEFVQQLLRAWDAAPASRRVIDLRQNSGGNSSILAPLIEGIVARPQLNNRNKLFVLIDELTGSSALLNAIQLSRKARGTLVGAPTGMKPNHYGEVRILSLPRSKMQISYPTRQFKMLDSDAPALMPDVTIRPTAAGYFAGRDPVLEWVAAQPVAK